jgi:acetoin utilization protein AcuC
MNSGRVRQFLSRVEEEHLVDGETFVRLPPRLASEDEIGRFHTPSHIRFVKDLSLKGSGYLDGGDTPAFLGMYEASAYVVGSTLSLLDSLAKGEIVHGFNPMGGLHHARRDSAAGFCVFNDVGVALETASRGLRLSPVLYVDIDAHHGDGVYYAFEEDPNVFIGDLHEDGRFLYPGTGLEQESGRGAARGTKVNIELQPGAGDEEFMKAFGRVLELAERAEPELVVLQCGADSLGGDPLAHLELTPAAHGYAATKLAEISHRFSGGRLLALGGGGYNPISASEAWLNVVKALGRHDQRQVRH